MTTKTITNVCVNCSAECSELLCDVCLASYENQSTFANARAQHEHTHPVQEDEVEPVEVDYANIYVVAHDRLPVTCDDLTDVEVLQAIAKQFPNGVNLQGSNVGPVWIHAERLLGMAHLDGFGLEMQGIVQVACEVIRLAADPVKAQELGGEGVDRLLKSFIGHARNRAISKRVNQLHAFRFGVSSKVAGADRVEPRTVEVHPEGRVAARLCQAFKCKVEDLEWKSVLILRHPFILGYVCQIVFNEQLTPNLALVNRLDFRKATHGDFDGDTANYFPIADDKLARRMDDEIRTVVPHNDGALAIRGIASHDKAMEMWGENPFEDGKTTEQKLTQSFTKSVDDWLTSHIKMGDMANKFTPFAYRISDVCSLMAAVGIEGARESGLMGAIIEEDFYLGLSGGPEGLDEAMETWFKTRKMSTQVRRIILNGVRTVTAPGFVTGQTAIALLEGARINQGLIDAGKVTDVITMIGWMIGKGRVSTSRQSEKLFEDLIKLGDDPTLDPKFGSNFLALMCFNAAYKLGEVVGKGKAVPGSDDEEADDPFAGLDNPFDDEDEASLGNYEW